MQASGTPVTACDDAGRRAATGASTIRFTRIAHLDKQNPLDQLDGMTAVSEVLRDRNLLEATSSGRFATGYLRETIMLRDGTCTADGCTNPGYTADIDHRLAYESGGATDPANLQLLCRRCHTEKSHGLSGDRGSEDDEPPE